MYIRIGLIVGFVVAVAWGASAVVVGYYRPIVAELETRVATANALAEAQNKELQLRHRLNDEASKRFADTIDKTYDEQEKTVGKYRNQLAAVTERLLKQQRAGCSPTRLPPAGGKHPELVEDPAPDFTIVSKEFIEFLKREALRADKVGVYADTCAAFVVTNNCGIKDYVKF